MTMIDTTGISYTIFLAAKAPENAKRLIAMGRKEAKRLWITELYDEWIEAEKACNERDAPDDLQRKRLLLEQKVRLYSLGIGGDDT